MLLPETGERMALASTQRFIFPGEFEDLVLPDFPPGMPSGEVLDTTICLSFTVNEFGETTDVKPDVIDPSTCDPTGDWPSLVAASEKAIESWEFLAAAICDYDTVEQRRADDDSCKAARSVTPIPVRLAWAFQFKADGVRRSVVARRGRDSDSSPAR